MKYSTFKEYQEAKEQNRIKTKNQSVIIFYLLSLIAGCVIIGNPRIVLGILIMLLGLSVMIDNHDHKEPKTK